VASQNFVTRPGSQFVQSGTGAVERTVESKLQDVVSVKDFGAVADGDVAGNGTDNTTAFQNAINTGKTVYVPKGIYRITGTIELLNGTKALSGDSNFPILVKTTPGPAIKIGATGSALNEQSRIENLYIMSPTAPSFSATPNATQAAVVVSGDGASNPAAVQHPQVLNIRIGNFGVGIYLADVVNARVEKCFIQMLQDYSSLPGFTAANRFVGILLDATPFVAGGISPMASTQLLDNDVSGAGTPSAVTSFGYWLVGSDIRDTFFDNCEAASVTYGYYVDSSTTDFNWNVHIRNAVIDAFKGNGIYILNVSGPGCITIDGGYFVGVTGASAAIYANNATGITVTGGAQILGYTNNTAGDDGVRLDNCMSCTIVGNSFQNCNYAISLNQSSYCTVAANHIFASTTDTESSPQLLTAIRVFSSSLRNTLVGNTVRGLNNVHRYDEGLLVQSGCTDNVIAHNIFDSTSVVTPYNILESTTSVTRSNAGTLTTKAASIVVDGTNDLSLVSQLGPVRFSPVNAERGRITSQGYLKVSSDGTYSGIAGTFHELRSNVGSGSLVAQISNTSATGNGVQIDINSNSTAYAYLIGYSTSSAANRIIIWSNGNVVNTNNSYGAISDIKLKENIVDANSQWDDLKALQVRNYNFKEGQTHTQIGLVAQEVELISPGLVSESPDRDEDGNDLGTVTKSVNYSVLYMKAVKALQEAMERIETLEAKVEGLEASP
jgi:parallel beta-helix repeat protein